jgi:predicted nucleic acid-binding protein
MPDRPFFDTNVLIYSFSTGDSRREIALDLLSAGGAIGVQTLNEFANVATGEMKAPWSEVVRWLETIQSLCEPAIPVSVNIHREAVKLAQQHRYHFYDALMLAAAIEASCTVFYSEDLKDGHVFGGLTIRNPFA